MRQQNLILPYLNKYRIPYVFTDTNLDLLKHSKNLKMKTKLNFCTFFVVHKVWMLKLTKDK